MLEGALPEFHGPRRIVPGVLNSAQQFIGTGLPGWLLGQAASLRGRLEEPVHLQVHFDHVVEDLGVIGIGPQALCPHLGTPLVVARAGQGDAQEIQIIRHHRAVADSLKKRQGRRITTQMNRRPGQQAHRGSVIRGPLEPLRARFEAVS